MTPIQYENAVSWLSAATEAFKNNRDFVLLDSLGADCMKVKYALDIFKQAVISSPCVVAFRNVCDRFFRLLEINNEQ